MSLESGDAEMGGLRSAVHAQLGVERPADLGLDLDHAPPFCAEVARDIEAPRRAELVERARALDPWLQGPFWLGGDVVVGGTWRNDARWLELREHLPTDLAGLSVVDLGANAGYDSFMFKALGAARVVACEPYEFIEQARFLESIYKTGVELERKSWQAVTPESHGRFDLVHCHGVLYHEAHPVALVQRLRELVADNGTVLLGTMMLADPALSEYARFVPGGYFGDRTWWWVPGRLAMRWMLEAVGLRVDAEFHRHPGPAGEFPTINGYFACSPRDPAPEMTNVLRSGG